MNVSVSGHKFEVWITSGSELEPLNGTFVDHVPKDTVIVIYGDMGKSEQLPLVAEEDDTSSSPGNTQYFKVITTILIARPSTIAVISSGRSLYYKRGEPYLCSAKAPVLDGSGSHR